MRVEVAGKVRRFYFRHHKWGTSAICEDAERGLVGESTAFLSKKDHYCKATGRRISLTRLLNALSAFGHVTREDRRLIWAEYFKNHGDLKK